MTNKTLTGLEQLNNLNDSLVDDIIKLSDNEFLTEADEHFGDSSIEVSRLKNIIQNALVKASKAKLTNAKNQVASYKNERLETNVIHLSFAEKSSIIKNFTNSDSELKQKLTLAAPKGEGIETENDIQGMFEDMLELGIIDEQGNPK